VYQTLSQTEGKVQHN